MLVIQFCVEIEQFTYLSNLPVTKHRLQSHRFVQKPQKLS